MRHHVLWGLAIWLSAVMAMPGAMAYTIEGTKYPAESDMGVCDGQSQQLCEQGGPAGSTTSVLTTLAAGMAGYVVDATDIIDNTAGIDGCKPTSSAASSGLKFVQSYEPYGTSGSDSGPATWHQNMYTIFFICVTDWKDVNGDRYIVMDYENTANAGTDSHVGTWYDFYRGYATNRFQIEASGSDASLVDYTPQGHTTAGDGTTVTFTLGYADTQSGGTAAVSWSHTFPNIDIYADFHTGAKTRWHTEENQFGFHGPSSFTSSYGFMQRGLAGTTQTHSWNEEAFFHHYSAIPNQLIRMYTNCPTWGDVDCATKDVFYTDLAS